MSSNRVQKSLLNILTGTFGQFLSFLLSFIIRTVFIKTLGEVYLGLNGLFSDLLGMLSLTELGIGTAIVIELYRTEELKDREKTQQYLLLYRKAYTIIGLVILICGLAMTPFLEYLVKDRQSLEMIHYRGIFLLFLVNTVFSYLSFAYRMSILEANQNEYKGRIVTYFFKTATMILQVTLLLCFKSIYAYLIVPIVLGIASTVTMGVLIGKWYPYILEFPKGRLSKEEVRNTWRNIGAVAGYKFSGRVIASSSSIIVSSCINIVAVGLYSNYLIITSSLSTILEKIFSSFTASLGSLNVAEGDEISHKYLIFRCISFLNFFCYGYVAICLYVCFTPFVKMWIGEHFLLNHATEWAIILNFLVMGLQETIGTHRAAYGLFYKGRYRPFATIILSVFFAFLFAKTFPEKYGVCGIILGGVVANFCAALWFDSYIVYKYAFHLSSLSFILLYCFRLVYCLVLAEILRFGLNKIHIMNNFLTFIVNGIITSIVFFFFFYLLFHKTKEFTYLLKVVKKLNLYRK